MNNKNSDKNIPALRFPGFTGAWEKKKLGEVSEKIQDGTHFSPTVFESGDYLYITSKNVKNGYLELSNAQYLSSDDHFSIYKRCDIQKGDVLLTKDGTIGQVCVNELPEQFSLLSSVAFIRPTSENSNYYIYHLLVSPCGQKEIESQIAGQALKRITLTKIKNFEFYFPPLPEQNKIASFLTAVDDKLQALKKKKSLLEEYKKGVMLGIFGLDHNLSRPATADGRIHGLKDYTDDFDDDSSVKSVSSTLISDSDKIRFRQDNGDPFPDWEVKKLGEVCEILAGGTPDTSNNNFWDGKIQWFTPTEIKSKFVLNSLRTISKLGLVKSSAKILPAGTILLTTRATIGEASIALKECTTNQGFQSLVVNNENNNIFIYYWIKMNKHEFISKANGSTFPEISKSEIQKLIIYLPSLPEQTKIANFLSAIDDKINLVAEQIEKTERWKKGLLQGMFV